ncbi:MAG: hypothetical protein AAB473_02705 [Patescibacteria group bacterium]
MKKMIKYVLGAMCITIVLAVFGIFWPSPVDGDWNQSGGNEDMSWYVSTSLHNHWFTRDGYPPIHEKGIYWVTGVTRDTYFVKVLLFPKDGASWRTEYHRIRIDDSGQKGLDPEIIE